MVCIFCDGETRVYNSRHQSRLNNVWRRRECLKCQTAFTSIEEPDLSYSVVVRKSSGKLQPFSRDKLFISIFFSLQHRKTALEDARALTDTVIGSVGIKITAPEVGLDLITDKAYSALKRFDRTAAVHYRAYYMNK